MMLLLSFASSNTVNAESNTSLSDGTYTVGEDISAGLAKFSIQKGTATIHISRGTLDLVYETLSDQLFNSNQFTASLKDGDKIEVTLDEATNLMVQ